MTRYRKEEIGGQRKWNADGTMKKKKLKLINTGVISGKPMDEKYSDEYKKILPEEIGNPELPVVWNVNVGHATPRCIIPLGVPATVDTLTQVITFQYEDEQ